MFLDDVDARCDENERIDGRAANADIVSFRSFFLLLLRSRFMTRLCFNQNVYFAFCFSKENEGDDDDE